MSVEIDGTGRADVATGVGFLDHMLEQLARHSLIDITVRAEGDLHIDDHHTVEDVGIALGQAVRRAMGDLRGLTRYADAHLPMDDTLTRVAVIVYGLAAPSSSSTSHSRARRSAPSTPSWCANGSRPSP